MKRSLTFKIDIFSIVTTQMTYKRALQKKYSKLMDYFTLNGE